ncbi:uncharacterized protein LOC125655453 [Ostrea edulis]|uniref:uncharacterized protein LOC125655453 n=1 Tax=Ostrea edulis TaxID=37623 RepID=UPI0024AF4C73|nr:uncharacterized protein LOC125655453 [Ostrea edulis]
MCGRNDESKQTDNEGGMSTSTEASTIPCDVNRFNTTGCNITIAGKLLIVLDTINKTLRGHFECFRDIIVSRLNGTNVTLENHDDKNTTRLLNKMNDLQTEFDGTDEAGMALILSDRENTSKTFDSLDSAQEPYIFFINVGQSTNETDSCYRHYKNIQTESELPGIGLELESTACNPDAEHMRTLCPGRFTTPSANIHSSPGSPTSDSPGSPTSGTVNLSIVVPSVIGAFILAVVLVLCIIFSPRRKRKPKRDTFVEFSAVDSVFGKQTMSTDASNHYSSPRETNDLYNALWEKEKNGNTDESQENYHHLDRHFVKQETNSSLYDHVVKGGDDLDDVFEPPS